MCLFCINSSIATQTILCEKLSTHVYIHIYIHLSIYIYICISTSICLYQPQQVTVGGTLSSSITNQTVTSSVSQHYFPILQTHSGLHNFINPLWTTSPLPPHTLSPTQLLMQIPKANETKNLGKGHA